MEIVSEAHFYTIKLNYDTGIVLVDKHNTKGNYDILTRFFSLMDQRPCK